MEPPGQKAGLEVPIQSRPGRLVPGFTLGDCLALFPKEHMEPVKNVLWPFLDPDPKDMRWRPEYHLLRIFITTSWHLFPGLHPNPDKWEEWKLEDPTWAPQILLRPAPPGWPRPRRGFDRTSARGLRLAKASISALTRVRQFFRLLNLTN